MNRQVSTCADVPRVAYLLNLRGSDIPFNPLFYAYLFISLDRAILFINGAKLTDEVRGYLRTNRVEWQEYNLMWDFLRHRRWGDGRILINPTTSYAIALILTSFRSTVAPSIVDSMKAVKNEVELEGLRRAYIRDGAAYVLLFLPMWVCILTLRFLGQMACLAGREDTPGLQCYGVGSRVAPD